MLETILSGIGFGIIIHAAGLTNWGGLPWSDLLGVGLPDMLLIKTAPQALATAVACALALWAVFRRGRQDRRAALFESLATFVLIGVLMTLYLVPDAWQGLGPIPGSLLAATLMGLSTGCLFATWGFAVLGSPKGAGPVAAISLVCNAALSVAAYSLQDNQRLFYLSALLAISAVIFEVTICIPQKYAGKESHGINGVQPEAQDCSGRGLQNLLGEDSPIRAQVVCMAALVFSFSFVRTTALSEIDDKSTLTSLGNTFVVVAAAAALAWLLLMKTHFSAAEPGRRHINGSFPYQAVFPVIATLAILMPVLSGTTLLIAAGILQAAFFAILAFLPLVAEGSCQYLKEWKGETTGAAAALLAAAAFLSVGVSTLFSWAIYHDSDVSVTTLLVCALAITYTMVLAYTFLQRDARFRRHHEVLAEEENLAARSLETPEAAATRRRGIEELSQTYCLTEREADVLLLLARGYSQHGISARLDVSDNTVRTHLRNLYRKLQIHSRQEAIELVELQRD